MCIILGSVAAVAVSLYVVKETQGDSDLLDLTQLELAYTTIIYSQQINDQGQPRVGGVPASAEPGGKPHLEAAE